MEPRERCVCAIDGVDQVVRILTPYEVRSCSPMMNLQYNKYKKQLNKL